MLLIAVKPLLFTLNMAEPDSLPDSVPTSDPPLLGEVPHFRLNLALIGLISSTLGTRALIQLCFFGESVSRLHQSRASFGIWRESERQDHHVRHRISAEHRALKPGCRRILHTAGVETGLLSGVTLKPRIKKYSTAGATAQVGLYFSI